MWGLLVWIVLNCVGCWMLGQGKVDLGWFFFGGLWFLTLPALPYFNLPCLALLYLALPMLPT